MSDLPPPTEPTTIQRPAQETPSDVVRPNPASTTKSDREPRRQGNVSKPTPVISKSKLKSALKSALKSGIRGGVGGVLSDMAINGALDAVQSLLDSAAEPVKRTDTDTKTSSVTGTPPEYQIEFLFDGKSFDTIQEVKSYVFGDYFKKNGYKKTRNNEGYYVEEVEVNYNERCYSGPGVGCMRILTHYGYISSNYDYNIGGSYDRYQINIAKVGKLDQIKETGSIKDYEQAQAQAKDRAINAAVEQYVNALTDEQLQQFSNDAQSQAQQANANASNTTSNSTAQTSDNTTSVVSKPNPNPNSKSDSDKKGNEKQESTNFELPYFCKWAHSVCNLADFIMQEPNLNDEQEAPTKQIDLKNPADFDKDYVNANAQCPHDIVKEFTTGFQNEKITFSFTPICDFAHDYLRPVILFLAYFIATITIASAFKVE